MTSNTHRGGCLCGAIQFTVDGPLPAPDACHCTQCRKHSGHYFVSTDLRREQVHIEGDAHLKWYDTERARRGFCAECGSSLFWEAKGHDLVAIAMGAFDGHTQTRIGVHIFTGNKGDYYAIPEGVPQYERTPRD